MRTGLARSPGVGALVIVAVPVIFWVVAIVVRSLQIAWLLDLAVLTAFVGLIGGVVKGQPLGILIDERNRFSLARLQTVMWSLVVLSAFGMMAFNNVRNAANLDPLAIAVPEQLWLALGITAVSLAGTPIIRSVKANSDRPPKPDVARRTFERMGKVEDTFTDSAANAITAPRLSGLIVNNLEPEEAAWPDVFQGEEAGNAALIDVGKVQMFFFSAVLISLYAIAIWNLLGTSVTTGFPPMSDSANALLGIANGTYLAHAAAPHTPTT